MMSGAKNASTPNDFALRSITSAMGHGGDGMYVSSMRDPRK